MTDNDPNNLTAKRYAFLLLIQLIDHLRNHASTTSGIIHTNTYDKVPDVRHKQKMRLHAGERIDSEASCVVNIEARESRSHIPSKLTEPALQQSVDSTCVATDSDKDRYFTSESDTEEPVEKQLTKAEKDALEREYSLGEVKALALEITTNPRTRKKVIRMVYNASSKQLLAKSDDFMFTYDCTKAETLYWTLFRDKADMSYDESERLAFIEEPADVRRTLYLIEINHIAKDLHALVTLLRAYLQT